MLDRRDPEYQQNREMAEVLLDDNWKEGLIGDWTYMRSLMLLGFLEKEARWRLSSMIMERSRRMCDSHEARRLRESREFVRHYQSRKRSG